MADSKFFAIMASAALAGTLSLSACGGQTASSSQSASTSSSEEATSKATEAPSAEETLISWQGALVDGSLVDYLDGGDGVHGTLVISMPNKDTKRWLGEMTTTDGKTTITDDTTKEVIIFTLGSTTEDGAIPIEIEGYGKGALVPMTAKDWQRVGEAEELAKTLETTVNWVGALEDKSIIAYMDNKDGSEAALAIIPANNAQMSAWAGKATVDEDGTTTITDNDTQQTLSLTATEAAEDGTLNVEIEGYGKGKLVKMTVADWIKLDALMNGASK